MVGTGPTGSAAKCLQHCIGAHAYRCPGSLHRIGKHSIERGAGIQAAPLDHLKHPPPFQLPDRAGSRLPIHTAPACEVVERGPGRPVRLRVAIEDEPDGEFAPAQPRDPAIERRSAPRSAARLPRRPATMSARCSTILPVIGRGLGARPCVRECCLQLAGGGRPRGDGLRHQARAGQGDAGAGVRRRGAGGVGHRRRGLRQRRRPAAVAGGGAAAVRPGGPGQPVRVGRASGSPRSPPWPRRCRSGPGTRSPSRRGARGRGGTPGRGW